MDGCECNVGAEAGVDAPAGSGAADSTVIRYGNVQGHGPIRF